MKICKCNNCETYMEDLHPSKESVEFPDTYLPHTLMLQRDAGGCFWGCPVCRTDEFLTDVTDKDLYAGPLFTSYKYRKVNFGAPTRVLRNLNRKGTWYSVKQKRNGRWLTVTLAQQFTMVNVSSVIYESVHTKVRETGIKSPHAYLTGTVIQKVKGIDFAKQITYDPFVDDKFRLDGGDFSFASAVTFTERGVFLSKQIKD